MEFMEDSEILSLFSGNASLWGQLPDEEELHLGSGLDSHLKETLDSTGPNSPQSGTASSSVVYFQY